MSQHNSQRNQEHMRHQLAQQAAKILIDSGTRDFHAAKQKAAQQLGAADTKSLPSNHEIETALVEYQRLFLANSQPEELKNLRIIAIEAMNFLRNFEPRLVGNVLSGTADINSVIRLHLFAETVESVGFYLADNKIPYELSERRLKIAVDKYANFSVCEFVVDHALVELVIFLPRQRQIPLSSIDGKPIKRASQTEVEQLIHSS